MRLSPTLRRRRGFTLVELLVAAALTVLIMAVMSTAFQAGMSTLSHLKSTVGLSEKLRSSEALIRRDLEAVHLQDGDGLTVRLSNPGLASSPWNSASARGYFEVVQGSAVGGPAFVSEGAQDGVTSYRATDHALFFTSKLAGDSRQTVYLGDVPAGNIPASNAPPGLSVSPAALSLPGMAPAGTTAFAAEWAEVGLMLVPTNRFTTADDGTNSLPLYSLVRNQRVIGATPVAIGVASATVAATSMRDANPEASLSTHVAGTTPAPGNTPYVLMNSPSSVVNRLNRLGYVWDGVAGSTNALPILPDSNTLAPTLPKFSSLKAGPASGKQGTDLILNDVVSMQIRVMNQAGVYLDTLPGTPDPTTGVLRLDTANAGGFGTQIRAIQIKLRVYDAQNHLTRQATITVDL